MKRRTVLVAALAMPAFLSACGDDTSSGSSTGSSAGNDSVTVALDWLAQPSNGAYYIADELGYYADAGIDVTIQAGSSSASAAQIVGGGGADFGLEYGMNILQARSQGIDIVSLAPTLQKSPAGYFFHTGQNITSMADFNGRTVYTQVSTAEWEYLTEKYALDDVTAVQFDYNYASFANDETAIVQGYATDQQSLEDQGLDVQWFETPINIDYGSSLFTTQELIDSDPDLVQRFVDATLKGWQYYYDHNDEASAILADYIEDSDLATIEAGGLAQQPYIWTDDVLADGFGVQTQERWDAIAELAVAEGVIDDTSAVDGAWTTEFTSGS